MMDLEEPLPFPLPKAAQNVFTVVGFLVVGKILACAVWAAVAMLRTHLWARLWDKRLPQTYGKWAGKVSWSLLIRPFVYMLDQLRMAFRSDVGFGLLFPRLYYFYTSSLVAKLVDCLTTCIQQIKKKSLVWLFTEATGKSRRL